MKDRPSVSEKDKGPMIEIICNDRLGNKVPAVISGLFFPSCSHSSLCQVRVKCQQEETIGNVKKIIAAQSGHRADKIRLQKWYKVFNDAVSLGDYEIHDGMMLEMHYN